MPNQRRQYTIHSFSRVLITIVIIVIVNVLLLNVSWRWDLTQQKQYTLSDASQKIISQLHNPVTLKVYFSSDVPQNLLAVKQDLEDLLAEYKQVGGDNIIITQADPKTDSAAQAEVDSYGIPQMQYNVVGNEKYEVSTGYAGLAIVYGSDHKIIPALPSLDNPEYQITSDIQKLSRTTVPQIGWLSDHGTAAATTLQQLLGQEVTVTPTTLDKIDPALKNLIIAGPTEPFTDAEQTTLDQFVTAGGNVYVLLDGMTINQQFLQASANESNLETLLKKYGITLNHDLISDFGSDETLNFGGQYFSVLRDYPYWPRIIRGNMNQDSAIVSQLQAITLPWPSSLTVQSNDTASVTELAKTTAQAYTATIVSSIDPDSIVVPDRAALSQYTVAALAAATIGGGHIMVVGNAQFIDDDILSKNPDNAALLLNAVDNFTQDVSLIGIRARSSYSRPIRQLDDNQKVITKYSNIFSSVIIVLLAAGGFYFWRKRRDQRAQQLYV